jgi:predicted nuclease of predicted toxin-antitoxin system
MPVALYMDEQVSRKITKGLRAFEVDVLTIREDGFAGMPDVDILDRASHLNRVVVTYDHHFVIEANRRLNDGIYFYGIV